MANYLTKKDMLRELHESKKSYSSYTDPKYSYYHAIVTDKALITDELIAEVVHARANPKGKTPAVILAPEDVVIRVMTHEHIPLDPDRKRKARNTDQSYARTNFPPFKHFIKRDGSLVEVGRSHWTVPARDWNGDLETGHFDLERGKINNKLATMFMLLVERIGRRPNWRNYSYRDEMEGHALVQLSQVGLMFDESKSDNPFAFYTTAVNHAFTRILNLEKRAQNIRDDVMEVTGVMPSITRQIEQELEGKFPKLAPLEKKRAKKVAAEVKIAPEEY